MLNFLLLMLIPLAIAIGAILYFKGRVTIWEFALQLAVPAVLMAAGLAIAYAQSTRDREIWNGRLTGKERKIVSCEHSYRCNCVTVCSGSGKSESCSEICQTCYEHSYDVSWYVYASTGEAVYIHRVNRQGTEMPPRWAAAFTNEPFSSEHSYTNYILANPDSVLLGGKGDVERFKKWIPEYPNVYDYYRATHVLNAGVPLKDAYSWEWLLDELNGDLGPSKQVNVLLLFVPVEDPRYVLALKDAWVGGKKNDAVVVIGSKDGRKIAFADVLSWTPAALYKVSLRDDLMKIGTLDNRDAIVNAIRGNTLKYFRRMHMKDYQYLVRSYQPSGTAMIVLLLLGMALSIGLAWWTVNNEFEDDSAGSYSRRYGYRYHNRRYL